MIKKWSIRYPAVGGEEERRAYVYLPTMYDADPGRFRFWEIDEYLDLFVEILRRLRPDLVVERFASEAPPRYHYGRNWGLVRNEQLLAMLEKKLAGRNAYQGEIFLTLQR